ncbi:MAG: Amidase, partial [Rhizobacter sp.]|nr:Amidase [Rhizobacter sp.]
MSTGLERHDLVGIAKAIQDGEVSAESATAFCIDRMERLGRACNAIVRLDAQPALRAARAADLARARGDRLGPLHGVPLAHKDLFYRAGRPSAGGSKIRADFVPTETASVLLRLDAAGALDLGAVHMAEFALSPTGYNAHYGHGLNPWQPAHIPGGSSSGSGIVVAG